MPGDETAKPRPDDQADSADLLGGALGGRGKRLIHVRHPQGSRPVGVASADYGPSIQDPDVSSFLEARVEERAGGE